MRLTVARLRRVIKRDFSIQFGREQLSSNGGLELLRRFFALIDLKARIQRVLAAPQLGGDYGAGHLVLLVIGLLVVGARRLSQLRYVAKDPRFARLCGLSRIPTDRTVGQNLLQLFLRHGCYYAVKVPFCKWTGVKALVAAQQRARRRYRLL